MQLCLWCSEIPGHVFERVPDIIVGVKDFYNGVTMTLKDVIHPMQYEKTTVLLNTQG